MNTKVLMTASALFLALLGAAASFLPQEILASLDAPAEGYVVLVVQIAGALYLGFAMLNWTARENLIGGIYSRPVALGNFLHFVMVALAMWKEVFSGPGLLALVVGAAAYTALAVAFGLVLFNHPRAAQP